MSIYPVTVNIPKKVYDRIRRAAEVVHRPIDEVLVEAVSAAAPDQEGVSEQLRTALAQMAYMNDAALWQAGRATIPEKHRKKLEWLHVKQQREGLTQAEIENEKALMKLYRETVLVRAHAAVLLKQRGYDIDNPEQFNPLS